MFPTKLTVYEYYESPLPARSAPPPLGRPKSCSRVTTDTRHNGVPIRKFTHGGPPLRRAKARLRSGVSITLGLISYKAL